MILINLKYFKSQLDTVDFIYYWKCLQLRLFDHANWKDGSDLEGNFNYVCNCCRLFTRHSFSIAFGRYLLVPYITTFSNTSVVQCVRYWLEDDVTHKRHVGTGIGKFPTNSDALQVYNVWYRLLNAFKWNPTIIGNASVSNAVEGLPSEEHCNDASTPKLLRLIGRLSHWSRKSKETHIKEKFAHENPNAIIRQGHTLLIQYI